MATKITMKDRVLEHLERYGTIAIYTLIKNKKEGN